MNKEEAKQYLRNQIDSCIKIQSKKFKNIFRFYYNNLYIRALKLSTITGKPVNKEDFTGGEMLFEINTENKKFLYYSKISDYLKEHYSKDSVDNYKLIEEVINEI